MYEKTTDEELKEMIARIKQEFTIIQKLNIKFREKQIDLYLDGLKRPE